MAFIVTARHASEGKVNVIKTFVSNLSSGKEMRGLGQMFVAICGDVFDEQYIAPPIPREPGFDICRWYFIPMSLVDPLVTNKTIYGIISQHFDRNHWLCPNLGDGYKLQFDYLPDVHFPPFTLGPPSPFFFQVVTPDTNATPDTVNTVSPNTGIPVTIKNVRLNRYVKADSPVRLDDFLFELTDESEFCHFVIHQATGTGPVMTSIPGALYMENYFVIMTNQQGGKALVASATEPYLSWAALDFSSDAQKFYFYAVSWPDVSSPQSLFVYNMLCKALPGIVFCFDDTNSVSIRPVADAGAWEAIAVETQGSGDTDYFGRIKFSNYANLNRLKATAGSGSTGSVSLVPTSNIEVPEDYFFLIPHLPVLPAALPKDGTDSAEENVDKS